jgi:cysteine sulfinate desulfinase/cysteine desulfurase-like protein
MGLTPEQARSSVRFSLGPGNSVEEVDALIEAVVESAAHLRRISATFRPGAFRPASETMHV